jgi:predicted peptidase
MFDMKKVIFCMVLVLGTGIIPLTAQEKISYIIVKSTEGEIASFASSTINRVYIENGKWVFELKKTDQKYSYLLEEVLPFTTEDRNETGIDTQLSIQSDWKMYDGGTQLIIENPNGMVGYYAVYDVYGRLLKTGYGSDSTVAVDVPSGNLYVVKVNGKIKKAVKK